MADINIIDIVKDKVGVEDTSAEGLIEAAQEKLDDGTIDETLEQLGVKNTSRISALLKGLLTLVGAFRSLAGIFGKKTEEPEEVEEEEEEEEEA